MQVKKRIALVAHDERKKDLIEWVRGNHEKLSGHRETNMIIPTAISYH